LRLERDFADFMVVFSSDKYRPPVANVYTYVYKNIREKQIGLFFRSQKLAVHITHIPR
jgi:hypothetical protein